MSDPDFATRRELAEAIAAVREDIHETEERLRAEFTNTVRYEVDRLVDHLNLQDGTLKWIYRLAFTLLVGVIASLVLLIR